jgi:hypothetical protein
VVLASLAPPAHGSPAALRRSIIGPCGGRVKPRQMRGAPREAASTPPRGSRQPTFRPFGLAWRAGAEQGRLRKPASGESRAERSGWRLRSVHIGGPLAQHRCVQISSGACKYRREKRLDEYLSLQQGLSGMSIFMRGIVVVTFLAIFAMLFGVMELAARLYVVHGLKIANPDFRPRFAPFDVG